MAMWYGFFALPYTIMVYPFVFAVMPTLWRVAADRGAVTAADVVRAEFGSRTLESAVAVTGVVATMPYIALQLIGMAAAIKALGITGELPLIAAFIILALYTYRPALPADAICPQSPASRRTLDSADPTGCTGLSLTSGGSRHPAVFVGWAVGMAGGTYMAWSDGLKPLHTLTLGDTSFMAYVGLIALVINIVVAAVVSLVMNSLHRR